MELFGGSFEGLLEEDLAIATAVLKGCWRCEILRQGSFEGLLEVLGKRKMQF